MRIQRNHYHCKGSCGATNLPSYVLNERLKAASPPSLACNTLIKHTIAKFEITNVMREIMIQCSLKQLIELLGIMSGNYFACAIFNFQFDECVFSQSVTHD